MISVLIPCFRCEAYFPQVLASLRGEMSSIGEVVCYFDGETDGALQAARQFGARTIVCRQNRGPAFSRNALLFSAKCAYVHFHDADDRVSPGFFAGMRDALAENSVAISKLRIVQRDGQEKVRQPAQGKGRLEQVMGGFVHLNSAIFHRESLINCGGFEPEMRLLEDRCVFLNFVLHGGEIVRVPEVEALWEKHPDTQMSREGWRNFGDNLQRFVAFMHRNRDRFDENEWAYMCQYVLTRLWDSHAWTSQDAHRIYGQMGIESRRYLPRLAKLIGLSRYYRLRGAWASMRKRASAGR